MNARLKTIAAPKPVMPLTADEMLFKIYEDQPSNTARWEWAAHYVQILNQTNQHL
jgi:hypothetical protein